MTAELLQKLIIWGLILFLLGIILILIFPKWRKKITEPKVYSKRDNIFIYIPDFIGLIFYPVIWLFRLIMSVFKG
ncbi:hypothetical protein B9T25_14235 [Acinetobacter sp. ANC 4470]|nr:hypothetical protein B9T25_14235 [Acinetobacter sp. ANC 4470]